MTELEERAKECADAFKPKLKEFLAEIELQIENAFEYGYAAGETDEMFRTKPPAQYYFIWHELEKNPDDLPDNKRRVWCDYGDESGVGFYDKASDTWIIEGHLYCSSIDAWCELPTRNKEKTNG